MRRETCRLPSGEEKMAVFRYCTSEGIYVPLSLRCDKSKKHTVRKHIRRIPHILLLTYKEKKNEKKCSEKCLGYMPGFYYALFNLNLLQQER